jgi:hypothetical protein
MNLTPTTIAFHVFCEGGSMNHESDEEPEVDPALQQVFWKIEAFIIKAMKASGSLKHQQIVDHALQQWAMLGRPENVNVKFVEERLAYLVKREWFAVSTDGTYTLLDLSQK